MLTVCVSVRVGRSVGMTDRKTLCVFVCVHPIDMEPVMWRSDHDLGAVP